MKADDYVRQVYRKTPERFPAGTIRKFGKQLVVTRKGMEVVTGKPRLKQNNLPAFDKILIFVTSNEIKII